MKLRGFSDCLKIQADLDRLKAWWCEGIELFLNVDNCKFDRVSLYDMLGQMVLERLVRLLRCWDS
jgi:hypothetical protein